MKKPGILIVVFLLLLVLIGGVSAYAFFDTQTVSDAENRTLAKRPSLSAQSWFSGAFATGAEDFLSDHVYNRAALVSVAKRMEALMERKTEIKLVSHNAADMAGNAATQAEQTQLTPEGEGGGTFNVGATAAEEEQTQDRLVLEDRILSVYRDAPDNLTYYAQVVNKFLGMFPDYINKYCLLAPSRIAFEPPDIAAYSDDQRAAIEFVYGKLDPLVTTIDAYTPLQAHSERLDDLYYRTDHHWTHLGAYYAAEAMFETIGLPYSPLEAYERREGNPFLGYYYAQDPDPALESHQDELVYYLPKDHPVPPCVLYIPTEDGTLEAEEAVTVNPLRGGYYTFAGSSFAYSVMDGARDDGGSLLLVADSYGNAFGTWLAENYSRVVQIDPRDYVLGREGVLSLAEEYGITDVMLCDYLGAVDSSYFPAQIEHLTE